MKNAIWIVLGLVTASLLTSSAFSRDVSDQGKFFSPDGLKKANQAIAQFKSKYNKDIVVETFPGIPEDKKSQYSPDKKNEFYTAWLRERAQALKVDGIYILITRDPAHLQVGVGNGAARMGFTRQDRDKVRDVLVDKFKRKEYDQGLNDAIAQISNRFADITRGRIAAAPARGGGATGGTGGAGGFPKTNNPAGLSWVTWLIIGIIGLLIVRFMIRAFQRMAYGGPRPPYGPGGAGPYGQGGGYGGGYPPPSGGGGGFFTSLLGGLFGGAAGNWLANKWTGGSQESQPGGRQFGTTGEEGGGGYDSSSGGDFGGTAGGEAPNGGGGDFGDSGSGDFGGGGGESGGGSDSGSGDF